MSLLSLFLICQTYPIEGCGQRQYGGSHSIFVHAGVVLQAAVEELDYQIKLLVFQHRPVRADMIAQLLGQGQPGHSTLQGPQNRREYLCIKKYYANYPLGFSYFNLTFSGL